MNRPEDDREDSQVPPPRDPRRAGQGPQPARRAVAQPAAAQPEKPKARRGVAGWVVLVGVGLLIVAGPPLLQTFVPGWGILVFLLAVAVGGGVVDARVFRFTYSFPVLVGVAYYLAMKMYFNSGTWIYLPVMVVLAFAGGAIGDKEGATTAWEGEE
ncbi:hypothetical protein VVR85_07020 [Corynebacterium sp. LK2590]|uniref:hypothetical protein n=1 Tax=unclassified Corynebacterium TaxID=2624378 RepID=UPI0034CF9C38